MNESENIDVRAAHAYFSKSCFNLAWDLIEKENKTDKEIQVMLHASHASIFHWMQRAECTDQNLSIGYWQLSRVYAVAGEGKNAIKYAEICARYSEMHGVAKVFLGYAYEALARGYALENDNQNMTIYLEKARDLAQTLPDEDREQLLGDLAMIEEGS